MGGRGAWNLRGTDPTGLVGFSLNSDVMEGNTEMITTHATPLTRTVLILILNTVGGGHTRIEERLTERGPHPQHSKDTRARAGRLCLPWSLLRADCAPCRASHQASVIKEYRRLFSICASETRLGTVKEEARRGDFHSVIGVNAAHRLGSGSRALGPGVF